MDGTGHRRAMTWLDGERGFAGGANEARSRQASEGHRGPRASMRSQHANESGTASTAPPPRRYLPHRSAGRPPTGRLDEPQGERQAFRAATARHASGRRRFVDPTTCDRDYSGEELEFMHAIQEYKRTSGRMFPTWSEVLEVLRALGYMKDSEPRWRGAPRRGAGIGLILRRRRVPLPLDKAPSSRLDVSTPSRGPALVAGLTVAAPSREPTTRHRLTPADPPPIVIPIRSSVSGFDHLGDCRDLMSVRTRFAPSPTGFLHIGGVRTALFNWLLARHHGGQFSCGSTTPTRSGTSRRPSRRSSTASAGWGWTGTKGPRSAARIGPYFQSQRGDIVPRRRPTGWSRRGHVYRDYSTEAERAARRRPPPRPKRAFRFRGKPADAEDDRAGSRPRGAPSPCGSSVPLGRTVVVHDLIKGNVEQKTDEIGDFVIVRPDGTPLYNFASVVDDAEMEITHVVRAEEHLSNTFPQLLVFEALGRAAARSSHTSRTSPSRARRRSSRSGSAAVGLDQFIGEGLSARGDDELPGPARLEPRRHPGDLLAAPS